MNQVLTLIIIFLAVGAFAFYFVRRQQRQRMPAVECFQQSCTLLQSLMEGMQGAVYIKDRDGKYLMVNTAFAQMIGKTPKEIIGHDELNLLSREQAEKLSGEDHLSMENNNAGTYEEEDNIDGEVRNFLVTKILHSDPDGNNMGHIGIRRDITDHKRTEDALRKLSRAVEQSPNSIVITDNMGRIEYVNPSFTEITGYSANEALGETPRIIQSGITSPLVYEDLWKTILSGKIWRGELQNKKKDGTIYNDLVAISPIKNKDGKTTHFVGIQTDISERKQAEEQVRQHQAELLHVARVSTMGQMASGLAHELNQPLYAIANYSDACLEMIRSDVECREKIIYALEQTSLQAQRAGEIIRHLKNFVRKQDTEKTSIDLNELVCKTVQFTDPEARDHGVTIQQELADDLPMILADKIQIEQVILNLLCNSIEAMCGAGSQVRNIIIYSSMSKQKGTVQLSVHDSGPGISTELQSRIFDSFYTTKVDGTGLGLSISSTIIKSHGGNLWVETAPTEGAIFHFTLPIGGEE